MQISTALWTRHQTHSETRLTMSIDNVNVLCTLKVVSIFVLHACVYYSISPVEQPTSAGGNEGAKLAVAEKLSAGM